MRPYDAASSQRELLRLLHELLRLHLGELRERAPATSRSPRSSAREQAIGSRPLHSGHWPHDWLQWMTTSSPDLPAAHLVAHLPDDPRGVGAGDVERLLVHAEDRDRLALGGPHAVEVDAGGHHHHQHVVGPELRNRHVLDHHRGDGIALALLADDDRLHHLRRLAQRLRYGVQRQHRRHQCLPCVCAWAWSETSSIRMPSAALGWRKPTWWPRAPGRGTLSMSGTPRAVELAQGAGQVVDGEGDVVQPRAPLVALEELLQPGVAALGRDQLDGAAGALRSQQERRLRLLRVDVLARPGGQPEQAQPRWQSLIEIGDADGDVIDAGDSHVSGS